MTSDLPCSEVKSCEWPRAEKTTWTPPYVRTVVSPETWDDKIIGCLAASGEPLTAAQVAVRIQRAPKMVRMFLGQLKKRKVVKSRPKVQRRERAGRPHHVWWIP